MVAIFWVSWIDGISTRYMRSGAPIHKSICAVRGVIASSERFHFASCPRDGMVGSECDESNLKLDQKSAAKNSSDIILYFYRLFFPLTQVKTQADDKIGIHDSRTHVWHIYLAPRYWRSEVKILGQHQAQASFRCPQTKNRNYQIMIGYFVCDPGLWSNGHRILLSIIFQIKEIQYCAPGQN